MKKKSDGNWFAVHAILWFKMKAPSQAEYSFWENVYLVRARSHKAAERKGAAVARQAEGDSQGSLRWNGEPATKVFGGIRKVVALSGALEDGVELTYSQFRTSDRRQLRQIIKGASARVIYEE